MHRYTAYLFTLNSGFTKSCNLFINVIREMYRECTSLCLIRVILYYGHILRAYRNSLLRFGEWASLCTNAIERSLWKFGNIYSLFYYKT